jgi:Kef-type K+ transport system membrane component KefB
LDFGFLPAWPPVWPSTVALGALAFLSLALGEVAARLLRLPRLLGYLAAGAVFGAGGQVLEGLQIEGPPRRTLDLALDFATAFVLFDLGHRVSFGWLRRNPALLAASLAESAATFAAVFLALRAFDIDPLPSALIAAISLATSPAVVLSITRELRTQGQVTERTLLLTALNCIYAIVLSTLLLGWAHLERRGTLDAYLLQPLYLVIGSAALAAVAARLLVAVLPTAIGRDRGAQIMTMLALVAAVFGIAQALRLSQLLALLACGAFVHMFDRRRRLAGTEFGVLSAFVQVLFFALSAATADFSAPAFAWGPALALIAVRLVCKIGAVAALAPFSGVGWRQGVWNGVALTPMSTLALLLARQVGDVYPRLGGLMLSVLVVAVVVLQVGGALALAHVMRASGEAQGEK